MNNTYLETNISDILRQTSESEQEPPKNITPDHLNLTHDAILTHKQQQQQIVDDCNDDSDESIDASIDAKTICITDQILNVSNNLKVPSILLVLFILLNLPQLLLLIHRYVPRIGNREDGSTTLYGLVVRAIIFVLLFMIIDHYSLKILKIEKDISK